MNFQCLVENKEVAVVKKEKDTLKFCAWFFLSIFPYFFLILAVKFWLQFIVKVALQFLRLCLIFQISEVSWN